MHDCLHLWENIEAERLNDVWREWCVFQYTLRLKGGLCSQHLEQLDLAPAHESEGCFDKDTLRIGHVVDPEECLVDFLVPLWLLIRDHILDTF